MATIVDPKRPRTGLKASVGALGGGGSGKRMQVDASKVGRVGRVSRAAARDLEHLRGVSLREKATQEAFLSLWRGAGRAHMVIHRLARSHS